MKKYIYVAIAVMIAGLISATAVMGVQNKSLRAECGTLKVQTQQQAETIKKLADMDAVSVKITFEVRNTAVLGSIKNGDYKPLLEGALHYTRGEVLKRADSIAKS
jgi:hypothetical protein